MMRTAHSKEPLHRHGYDEVDTAHHWYPDNMTWHMTYDDMTWHDMTVSTCRKGSGARCRCQDGSVHCKLQRSQSWPHPWWRRWCRGCIKIKGISFILNHCLRYYYYCNCATPVWEVESYHEIVEAVPHIPGQEHHTTENIIFFIFILILYINFIQWIIWDIVIALF